MSLHTTRLTSVKVIAEPLANEDNTTALDIAFVYDEHTARAMPKTSPVWFEKKPTLLEAFDTSLVVVSLELAPGSVVSEVTLPNNSAHAIRVIAYAAYGPPAGQSVFDLTQFKLVVIKLKPNAIEIAGS